MKILNNAYPKSTRYTTYLLALATLLTLMLEQASAGNYKFIDERNLISSYRVQKNELTLRVYRQGKEDPSNPDPINHLILIRRDGGDASVYEATKTEPGTFLIKEVPYGTYEIQTEDLNGQPLERKEVDRPHEH